MYATLFILVGRNFINGSMGRGNEDDHALLGEPGKLYLFIGHRI